jgi:putative transposase
MAKLEHYFTRFEAGEFYHVYNRSIDKKPMFITDKNREYFLTRLFFFLEPVTSIYAYTLLNNHFHLAIKVNDDLIPYRLANEIPPEMSDHDIVSRQFRRFFQSYALAFNKQHERCGTLFQTPFKRARIKNSQYLIHLIYYIHTNAQKHGLIANFLDWKWSSYHHIISESGSAVDEEIISWFGNKKGYINFHNRILLTLTIFKDCQSDQHGFYPTNKRQTR